MSRIQLRPLRLNDAEPMLEWMVDPDIYSKMQYDYKKLTLEKCILFIKNSWDNTENLHLAITDASDEYLGTVSLKNIDYKNKRTELGIVVHPKYMGKGVAASALREIAKKAFFELKLNRIYLYVRADNIRAVTFYKKNKLEYEGCSKEYLLIEEEYKDVYWFSLRKRNYNEWNKE